MGLIGGVIYNQVTAKKSYDYSDYYVETKTTKKESKKENEEASEKELSLSLLKQTNNDVVGILEFDDRIIYEPIVQASNNDYYVRKNINKEYANAGIPFVSADGNIDSKNVVIYGHSSKWDNIIFTPLMSYTDQNYYKKHDTFKFITEDETKIYQIPGGKKLIYTHLNMPLIALTDLREMGEKDDRLTTLVTCDTRDNNKRIVILAKLVNIANV